MKYLKLRSTYRRDKNLQVVGLIRAAIVVERESQKGIMIGKQGGAMKKLGQSAREGIEEFLQRPVYLELRVKVREKWRTTEKYLKSFGYSHGNDED